MKRIKCYGRQKTALIETSATMNFFDGGDDSKTSLWVVAPLGRYGAPWEKKTYNEQEKENIDASCFQSPSLFRSLHSEVSNSHSSLVNCDTTEKKKTYRKNIANKGVCRQEKRKHCGRKKLKERQFKISSNSVLLDQPNWSEIEDTSFTVEKVSDIKRKKYCTKVVLKNGLEEVINKSKPPHRNNCEALLVKPTEISKYSKTCDDLCSLNDEISRNKYEKHILERNENSAVSTLFYEENASQKANFGTLYSGVHSPHVSSDLFKFHSEMMVANTVNSSSQRASSNANIITSTPVISIDKRFVTDCLDKVSALRNDDIWNYRKSGFQEITPISMFKPVYLPENSTEENYAKKMNSSVLSNVSRPEILEQKRQEFCLNLFDNKKSRTCHNSPDGRTIVHKEISLVSVSSSKNHRSCVSSLPPSPHRLSTSFSKIEEDCAKSKLLLLCNQTNVLPFSVAYKWSTVKVKKIGEGAYGEVFTVTARKTSSVLKIIPISSSEDESYQALSNVLSEVQISQCLSELRNHKNNRTKNFIKLKRSSLVVGLYPSVLIRAWDSFSEAKSTYNSRPDVYNEHQLYVILELEYGGKDMSCFVLKNAAEAESVWKQIAVSLAIAEEEHLFEHRDLHLGNILIRRNRSKTLSYILRGKPISIESCGLFVTIIDFTLSRLCEQGYIYYYDLAEDASLFNQSGDIQFDVYRAMKLNLENQWHECLLYSNVLWLKFLCVKLREFQYSRPVSAKQKIGLKNIQFFEKQLDSCKCALDSLIVCKIVSFIPSKNVSQDSLCTKKSILVARNSYRKSKSSLHISHI